MKPYNKLCTAVLAVTGDYVLLTPPLQQTNNIISQHFLFPSPPQGFIYFF